MQQRRPITILQADKEPSPEPAQAALSRQALRERLALFGAAGAVGGGMAAAPAGLPAAAAAGVAAAGAAAAGAAEEAAAAPPAEEDGEGAAPRKVKLRFRLSDKTEQKLNVGVLAPLRDALGVFARVAAERGWAPAGAALRFEFDGDKLTGDETPDGLGMEENDLVDVAVIAAAPAAPAAGRGGRRR